MMQLCRGSSYSHLGEVCYHDRKVTNQVLYLNYLKSEELNSLRDGWVSLHYLSETPCAEPHAACAPKLVMQIDFLIVQ